MFLPMGVLNLYNIGISPKPLRICLGSAQGALQPQIVKNRFYLLCFGIAAKDPNPGMGTIDIHPGHHRRWLQLRLPAAAKQT